MRIPPERSTTPVAIVRLERDRGPLTYYGGITQPTEIVVRDSARWHEYWSRIFRGVFPPPPPPTVDFGHDIVVVAALGSRPTGGWGIVIDSAYATTAGLRVVLLQLAPGTGCVLSAVVTAPVDAAVIHARPDSVEFVQHVRTESC